MDIRKLIKEEVRKTLLEGYAGKVLPIHFNHLKWDLNRNQKYYLQEMCDVDPNSLRDSDFKGASKFLGIPEKNVKSIINTYNTYNPMSEGALELPSDSPLMKGITSADAGMNIDNMNRTPVRANRTTYPNQDHRTQREKKTMDYAIRKNRVLDRSGNLDKKKSYQESVHTSLMMYLFCEVHPKDINLNHRGQIQIDQEPILLEGESFNMENSTYRKVDVLLQSFNEMFNTNFRVSDHVDLSETTHKCHRTFVEHYGNEKEIKMPVTQSVDHRELMDKYMNGDLISYNPNADWLL